MFHSLFSLEHSRAGDWMREYEEGYAIIPNIAQGIKKLIETLDPEEFIQLKKDVWVAKTAQIDPSATILGPCIIDHNAQIRCNAFIRENVIIGQKCVVGNATELKNCILFDQVAVPHFNYVGDSILGFHVHLGAGAIISNFKSDGSNIWIIDESGNKKDTKLRKLGAFIGDYSEIGCNCVLNPGTIIGKNVTIYPLSSIRGRLLENTIYKNKSENCIKKY